MASNSSDRYAMANSKRKSLYDDEAMKTMLRQAKEGEIVFKDNNSSSQDSNDSNSEESKSSGSPD